MKKIKSFIFGISTIVSIFMLNILTFATGTQAKGGYGESKSNFIHHVIAGSLCLIGAVLVFVVLGWSKDLFSI